MRRLCPSARSVGRAVLPDHRLTFPRRCGEWGGGVASVEPMPGEQVEGVLFEVDTAALEALDAYEEVHLGYYRRAVVTVAAPDGEREAWVYLATAEPDGPFPPSPAYCEALVTGLESVGASTDYVTQVRRLARP